MPEFILDPTSLEEPQAEPVAGLDLDQLAAEQEQIGILLNEGATFLTPKRSWLRFFGAKNRQWLLRQPYLGTSDYLAREWVHLDFDGQALQEHQEDEARRLMAHNARRCARIVAIALLNGKWKIKLLTAVFANYLLWRIKPDKLLQLVVLINRLSNLQAFTLSIRLMSMNPRKTQPTRIEKNEGNRPD